MAVQQTLKDVSQQQHGPCAGGTFPQQHQEPAHTLPALEKGAVGAALSAVAQHGQDAGLVCQGQLGRSIALAGRSWAALKMLNVLFSWGQ